MADFDRLGLTAVQLGGGSMNVSTIPTPAKHGGHSEEQGIAIAGLAGYWNLAASTTPSAATSPTCGGA